MASPAKEPSVGRSMATCAALKGRKPHLPFRPRALLEHSARTPKPTLAGLRAGPFVCFERRRICVDAKACAPLWSHKVP
jgi:hypothetical protein